MKLRTLGGTMLVLLAAGALLLSLVLISLARQFDAALQSVSTSYASLLLPLRQIDVNTNKMRFHLLAFYMHNPALPVARLHHHPLDMHLAAVRTEMAANEALWTALARSAPSVPQADLGPLRAAYRDFEQRCLVASLAAAQANDWSGVVRPITSTLLDYVYFEQQLQDWIAALHVAEQKRSRSILLQQQRQFVSLFAAVLVGLTLAARLAWSAISRHDDALLDSNRELEKINLGLEHIVECRTKTLGRSNDVMKHALQRLRATQSQLVQNEKLAALGSLVAGVAHELSTPIGNALLSVSTLSALTGELSRGLDVGITRSALSAHLRHAGASCEIIERALNRASNLLDSFKRVAADPSNGRRLCFSLAGVVTEALAMRRAQLLRASCEVQVSVAPDLRLDSYPDSVLQVLHQLIDNSLLHGFAGRPRGVLIIRAVDLNPHWITITVGDDGAGVAPQLQQRMFDPFFTTRMGQGSGGLGLAIAHNIVTAILGGRIAVVPAASPGTLVEMTLPKVAPVRQDAPQVAGTLAAGSGFT